MSVRVTDHTDRFINDKNARSQAALRMVAEQAVSDAHPHTPRKTGDLRRTVSVRMAPKRATITWEKAYAAAQDKGTIKGRKIRNYTTPGTGPGFTTKGVQSAIKKAPGILKGLMR